MVATAAEAKISFWNLSFARPRELLNSDEGAEADSKLCLLLRWNRKEVRHRQEEIGRAGAQEIQASLLALTHILMVWAE